MRATVQAIRIEPGQGASRCKLCFRVIYWGVHPTTGNTLPVSVNGKYLTDARPPTRDRAGSGIDHHIDCPPFQQQQAVLREQREAEKRVVQEQQIELPLLILSR